MSRHTYLKAQFGSGLRIQEAERVMDSFVTVQVEGALTWIKEETWQGWARVDEMDVSKAEWAAVCHWRSLRGDVRGRDTHTHTQ